MADKKVSYTRRSLLTTSMLPSAGALLLPAWLPAQLPAQAQPNPALPQPLPLPILDQPDLLVAYTGDTEPERHALSRLGTAWTSAQLRTEFLPTGRDATIVLESPHLAVRHLHLRWKRRIPEDVLALGDAWERSYGDLAWRPLQAERALPWYAMLHLGEQTVGMGVRTGSASFAFWQVDPLGISLWLDVRNGGNGVQLGPRRLEAATLVACRGEQGESAYAVTRRLCQTMAAGARVPTRRGSIPLNVLYGSNDWYYAYGKNTSDGILRDADLVRSLVPDGAPRPLTVIDDGYQDRSRFPDMPKLAEQIRSRNVVPGLWIRPLRAPRDTNPNLLLSPGRWRASPGDTAPTAFDPTIPEALEAIAQVATRACAWGFDLIKHDFTTWELLGQWGSQMGASPTLGDWRFHDPTRTNAEIVTDLYRRLRKACGEQRVILGCNTIGHLSAGLFDASRTGDDVSGRLWERTRRMGVNTLAFRMPQHRTFYALDADCVPITPDVPWSKTLQWLQAVASSGSVLLISPDPRSVGAEQKKAFKRAFALCAQSTGAEPLDWTQTQTPSRWQTSSTPETFEWVLDEGETPFPIGVQRSTD